MEMTTKLKLESTEERMNFDRKTKEWMDERNNTINEWIEMTKLNKTGYEDEEYDGVETSQRNWTTKELLMIKELEWRMESRVRKMVSKTRKMVPQNEIREWTPQERQMAKKWMEWKKRTIYRKQLKRVLEEMTEMIPRVGAMDDCVNNQPEATADTETMTEPTKQSKKIRKKKRKKKKKQSTMARDDSIRIGTTARTNSNNNYYWNRVRPPERTKEVTAETTTKQPKERNKGYYWYRGRPPERVQ
jgi:hypothetical protein